MAKQRIVVFGGTFDPVHEGHMQMARGALSALDPDLLLVMPSGSPPYKKCDASPEDRWRMVVCACAGNPRLVPSRLEIDRSGSVYTVDTLLRLKKEYPDARLFFVVGADALLKAAGWHRIRDALSLCTLAVLPRPGVDRAALATAAEQLASMGGKVKFLPAEPVSVSSTEIRAALSGGAVPDGLNAAVREYCACKGLYGAPVRVPQAAGWIDSLFVSLKPRRFAHSLSVADESRRLALLHGVDSLKAEQAGILHDCAKCLPLSELQRLAREHGLVRDPSFADSGALLHAPVGARVARDRYGMADPEVLEAIALHTTGAPGMSRLAMCVCLADSIESLRDPYPGLERVRALADQSLEQALLLSLERTADYVLSRGNRLDPQTRETIAWLRERDAVLPRVSP